MFDYRRNPRSIKPGDIVRVTFKNGDPFNGVVLSIKLRGIDTSFLLRNELTRVAVEMSVKVFNPNVQSVEIVQRAQRKIRRARLYYMRFVNYPDIFESVCRSNILLIASCLTGLASTTAAVSRMLSMPIFARRGRSWASGDCTSVRSDQFSIFRMYYYLFISNLFQYTISFNTVLNQCNCSRRQFTPDLILCLKLSTNSTLDGISSLPSNKPTQIYTLIDRKTRS